MEDGHPEGILDGFRKVFKFLVNKTPNIADDAILHILIDVLDKNASIEGQSFIKCSGVLGFLESVRSKTCCLDTSTSVLVFGLSICSWLGGNEKWFKEWTRSVMDFVGWVLLQMKGSEKQDVSVVAGLYDCLCKILKHEQGLESVCKEFKDQILDCLNLLEAGLSIFMEKSIIDFLTSFADSASLLCQTESCELREELFETNRKVADKVCHMVHTHAMYAAGKGKGMFAGRRTGLTAVLKLADKLIGVDGPTRSLFVDNQEFVTDVMEVYRVTRGAETEIALRIIEMILNHRKNIHFDDFAETLWREGDVIKALKLIGRVNMGKQPSDQCHQMLVAPLHLVVDKGDHSDWTELLRSQNLGRSKLLDILSTSFSCFSQAKMDKVRLIAELLEATVDASSETAFIHNNRKVQRSCLQHFLDSTEHVDTQEKTLLLASTVQIIKRMDIDSMTYSLCMKCLQSNLPLLLESPQYGQVSLDLASTLQRHLCAIHWELRDTTVEFLGQVLREHQGDHCVVTWLQSNGLHAQIWHCVQDGESYVRASAISALWEVYSCRLLWKALLEKLEITEETAVETIVSVLASDSEAFARRSAARFLSSYLKMKSSASSPWNSCPQVLHALLKATEDFDWEVKLCALEFIDSMVQDHLPAVLPFEVPEYAKGLIQTGYGSCETQANKGASSEFIQAVYELYDSNVLSSLLKSLDDYDEKVCEKACEVVTSCKEKLCKGFGDACVSHKNIEDMFDKVPYSNGITEISEGRTGDCDQLPKRSKLDENVSKNPERTDNDNVKKDVIIAVHAIINFDTVDYRAKFQSKRDYLSNPLSLIQDILAYGDREDDDNLVDCY